MWRSLVARGVWDAEVGGSSPLTPTLQGERHYSRSQSALSEVVVTEINSGSFESLVARRDTHAVVDLASDGRTLLIVFGGIAGGVSMPVFEFFRLTSAMPGKKVFLRDPLRGWYQLGIPGLGRSAADIRQFLEDTIDRADVDRVVMAGASAGGFAALLFGAWCNVDEVLAFSPQTFIDPHNRELHGDDRWAEQIDDLYRLMPGREPTLDLQRALSAYPSKARLQVHVSTDDELDMIHARRIEGIAGVTLYSHERGGHRLVKTLRDRGLLQPLLIGALSGPSPASPIGLAVSHPAEAGDRAG